MTLAVVKVGMKASFRVAGFDVAFQATLTQISGSVQQDGRTLRVRLEVPNTDGRLKSGLFAELKLTSDGRERLAQLLTERELAKQDILGLDTEAGQSEVMKHRVAVARDWRTRLKDEFGGRTVRVRGHAKVMCHLMFGILALAADQILRLIPPPSG